MNVRKRFTALALSASAIGLMAIPGLVAGWHAVQMQTASAKESFRSERNRIATPSAMAAAEREPHASPNPLETLIDRCSTSVRIEPALIFDQAHGGMVPGAQAPIRLKRPANKNTSTTPTDKRSVGLPTNGRFAWFCGPTANKHGGTLEHSNCPARTNSMRASLGPDRLLKIQCLPD
jgi:hypothetical protein